MCFQSRILNRDGSRGDQVILDANSLGRDNVKRDLESLLEQWFSFVFLSREGY